MSEDKVDANAVIENLSEMLAQANLTIALMKAQMESDTRGE